jgi:hydroxymethylpyrimidine/phosphomethylpyrimidine kinase
MKKVLTIAGSDCSGGAGIQADLKTIAAFQMYGMSAVTALVAENTVEVRSIQNSTPAFLADQLDCVLEDIFPDAVKIGMVSDSALISVIAEKLKAYAVKNIVVDPVMVATSGGVLMEPEAMAALTDELLPLATVMTPNLPEAEALCGMKISDKKEMEQAAAQLGRRYAGAILVKGGHLTETADDLLWQKGEGHWLTGQRVDNPNTHGTGCTLSSAIACGLAQGLSSLKAVQQAKDYLTGALRQGLNLGRGKGPVDHGYWLERH